jgi:hypothetical protein
MVRVRDHIALSTAGAAALRPWLGRDVLGFWTGAVLVDVDHYAWFRVRQGRWSPVSAMRFFNQAHAPQDSTTRMLHSPFALLAVLLFGVCRRRLVSVALGMGLHVALDVHHDARMDQARAAALERDDFTCQACGARTPDVGTHLRRQPLLLPSYSTQDLISLCGPCHDTAHRCGRGFGAWR